MNDMAASPQFDRTAEDLGNIVELGHVNVTVPDQSLAVAYYLMGLGLTRDPYLMAGLENMWVNVGKGQFHLPTRGQQVVRGLANMLESPAGNLWTRSSGEAAFRSAANWNMRPHSEDEDPNSPFCRFLDRSGWVINIEEYRNAPQRYEGLVLPSWLLATPQAWLVVPLRVRDELTGFVVLASARTPLIVNWEVNDLLKTAGRQAASFLAQMQRNFDNHAAMRRNHCGRKQWRVGEAAMHLHFGHMFVAQRQGIVAIGNAGITLEPCNQRFAAAGIARHGMAAIGPVARHQAMPGQRRKQGDEAGGIAAWIADPRRLDNLVAPGDLGKSESPAIRDAVGR